MCVCVTYYTLAFFIPPCCISSLSHLYAAAWESLTVALVDRASLLTRRVYASQCLHNSQSSIKSPGLCVMTLSQITSHTLSLDIEVILLVFESYEVLKKPRFLFQMSESAHGV